MVAARWGRSELGEARRAGLSEWQARLRGARPHGEGEEDGEKK